MSHTTFAVAAAIADAFNRCYQATTSEQPNAEVLANLAGTIGQILEDAGAISRTGFLDYACMGGLPMPTERQR